MRLHDSGRLVVASGSGAAGDGSLWWVDPASGAVELLSSGNALGDISGIASQAGGSIVTVDANASDLVVVDPLDGAQTLWPAPGPGFTSVVVIPAP
jgi:streptogramin lyase